MERAAVLALAMRIVVALCTGTFFQPDEYFQALEPAHRWVFGYGHRTWEWVVPAPVRSPLYPALNVPVFWALWALGWDSGWSLIVGTKILHGSFAAITDISLRHLTRNVLGERYVQTAFFLSITSFFHILALSRSLSNSLETSLTTAAAAFYPWDVHSYSRRKACIMLIFAALACAVRPTNAVIWIYLIPLFAWRTRHKPQILVQFLLDVFLIGTLALAALFALDSAFYGRPTFTTLNFLLVNLSPVALFYGRSPAHYYLSQGLPMLATTALPFVMLGAWQGMRDRRLRALAGCVGWAVAVYSLAGHKEWRFLHPLLPFMHVLAAKALVDRFSQPAAPRPDRAEEKTRASAGRSLFPPLRHGVLVLLLLPLPASLYVVLFHCSSQISVMRYLRTLPPAQVQSVGFLMPCHSVPGHAYLHRPDLADEGRYWALGCEPPLGVSIEDLPHYKDQTDIFYESPVAYVEQYFPARVNASFPPSPRPCTPPGAPRPPPQRGGDAGAAEWQHEWPQLLVLFGALLEERHGVRRVLGELGYAEVWRAGASWEGEGKRRGGVRVWRYRLDRIGH